MRRVTSIGGGNASLAEENGVFMFPIQEQRTAARVAGFTYLFLGALAAFAEFYVRSGTIAGICEQNFWHGGVWLPRSWRS